MRIAIVGTGYWGSKHVRAFSSTRSVSKVVVVDERMEARQWIGRAFPNAVLHSSLEWVLDDVDAVVVATPPETHFDIASQAIAAGKHVLVEKPMATRRDDAIELLRMAEQAGVTLATGHTFLYSAAVQKLIDLAHGGAFGKLHFIDSSRLNLGKYQSAVNVLWDLAAHDVSIATALVGATPDTVSAWGSRHTDPYGEDIGVLRMTFDEQQVEATARVSWLDPVKVRRMTVVGSQQMAVYDDTDTDSPVRIFDRGRRLLGVETPEDVSISYRYGQTTAPHLDAPEPLLVAAEDFVRCCMTGESPISNGAAGLNVVSVLEASNRSLEEHGAPVPVAVPAAVPFVDRRSA